MVFHAWGFGPRLALGGGVTALFAGPSGSGKTLAAQIVAATLGLELYRVDLPSVVSKYIGDTEKVLDGLFREAHGAGALLFFDEADALFGKRSEVRDAHDRYANIEISYLLQALEQYDGLTLLATNLRHNLDDAFIRRLSFCITFPFPEEPERRRLWAGCWPPATPVDDDVDVSFLARQFKLTGGNIRNIALAAAFAAAADGSRVTMPHVIRGVRREYQKMGKACAESEFGPWFGALAARGRDA
jgi:SpoVK/Ycf46/Vps4 family AAA+-type ATPase